MYKRYYAFRINVVEEIFEIRSCIEILENHKVGLYTLEDLHPLGGKSMLNMCLVFK